MSFAESDALVSPDERAQLEVDLYAGIGRSVGQTKLRWDAGVIYYAYPGAASGLNYDYGEIYGKVAYDFGWAALEFALNYTNEFFAESGKATYYQLNVELPLPKDFALSAHVGKQNIDDNASFGTPDYTDYKLGVSKQIRGFALALL